MTKKITIFLLAALLITSYFCLPAAAYDPGLTLTSQSVMLVNTDTDTVVYQNNAEETRYPASLTKVMTCILVLEKAKNGELDLEAEATAPGYIFDELFGTGSSNAGIKKGEVLTIRQLLYCMMLQSANEAAMVLADYVGNGDINAFIEMMNQKAQELGAVNTHFVNVHGLHSPDHYSCAKDMIAFAKYALTLPLFEDLISVTRYHLPATNKNDKKILVTTNLMMDVVNGGQYYYKPVKGIKTGSTSDAGFCFLSTAENDGYHYMAVCMGAPYRNAQGKMNSNGAFLDTKALYKWAFENLRIKSIVKEDEPVAQVKLSLAWDKDVLLLKPETGFSALVPKEADASSVQLVPKLPESYNAPVKAGDIVGTADLKLAGEVIGNINLVSTETVERSQLAYVFSVIQKVVSSIWFKLVIVLIVLAVILYIILSILHNKRRQQMKKVKRYRRL